MPRCTAEERALARAALYRTLALAFSYPLVDTVSALRESLPVAKIAAGLLDEKVVAETEMLRAAFELASPESLEGAYQRVFTLSYSEDCPAYETAYSGDNIFQQTAQQADIVGFYRAFGVDPQNERSDHLAIELEFAYLLAAKEARARELGEAEHIRICREAQRSFMRQHLARWAPLIGQRVALTGAGTMYGAAGALLGRFVLYDERFLRLGKVARFRDEPVLIADEPGEMECPVAETAMADPADLPFLESTTESTVEGTEEARHASALPS